MVNRGYPETYSLAEVTFVDGTQQSFMLKASPAVAKYLTSDLKELGALVLYNDTDTLVVMREQLRSFSLRRITLDERQT